MQVKELLDQKMGHHAVCSILRDEPVYDAAKRMTDRDVGILAVMHQNKLVGVISERDILNKVVSKNVDPHGITVGEIMSTNLVIAKPDESFEDCERRMKAAHCRHVLIVDSQKKLVGLISLRDVLDASNLERHQEVLVDDGVIWTVRY